MSDTLFSQVAIIGLGQMGASLALSLKAGGRVESISGYDLHPDHSATALSIEAIDRLAPTAADAVSGADLVILCTPVGSYSAILQSIRAHLKPNAVITDIGSIKSQAIRDVQAHLPEGVVFVPSHPVAGSEKVGPYHAHSQFFARRLFLICPTAGLDESLIERIGELWQSTQAHVDVMPAPLHDQVYAYMSHLPQLMAFAAAPVLDTEGMRATEEDLLFKRFIRIGRSDPEMWRDVFMENAANVLQGAEHVKAILTHIRTELHGGAENSATAPDDATRARIAKEIWPRIIASALIMSVGLMEQQMEMPLARYAAGGFTDFTAPITESPEPDMELVSQFTPQVVTLIDAYLAQQQLIVSALGAASREQLLAQLAVDQACAKRLIATIH